MFVLGALLGFGLYVSALSMFDVASGRLKHVDSLQMKLQSPDFLLQVNVSIILGISFALLAGMWFPTMVLYATLLGLGIGWLGMGLHISKQRRELKLRLSLATASLAEDCAILSTTHLGIRQAFASALQSSIPELQRKVACVFDIQSTDVLLLHQLQELSRVERENALGRFARTLAMALERGTSPESSLFQLAEEVRSSARRELLHLAAKKEIAMMVPVVFAILPSVTAVALFPAMKSLQHL